MPIVPPPFHGVNCPPALGPYKLPFTMLVTALPVPNEVHMNTQLVAGLTVPVLPKSHALLKYATPAFTNQ